MSVTDGTRLTLPLPAAVAAMVLVIGWTGGGALWLGNLASTQSAMSDLLHKIDGRTESFAVIARRVDGVEANVVGLSNQAAQTALDVRTVQLQLDENRRGLEGLRTDVGRLQDWQRAVNARPQ